MLLRIIGFCLGHSTSKNGRKRARITALGSFCLELLVQMHCCSGAFRLMLGEAVSGGFEFVAISRDLGPLTRGRYIGDCEKFVAEHRCVCDPA